MNAIFKLNGLRIEIKRFIAKAKYGENYKEMKSYSHYNTGYDIYLKKEGL